MPTPLIGVGAASKSYVSSSFEHLGSQKPPEAGRVPVPAPWRKGLDVWLLALTEAFSPWGECLMCIPPYEERLTYDNIEKRLRKPIQVTTFVSPSLTT